MRTGTNLDCEVESFMWKETKNSDESPSKLHLRYIRLPNQVKDIYDDLIYRSKMVIVNRGRVSSAHRVVFDGDLVLAPGYQMIYFELMEEWFGVGKVRNLRGEHTGYYCDIVTPPRLLEDGGVELTDLFLDLWVSPDLRYKVLDEEELEDAFSKGRITERLHKKAKEELRKLVAHVEQRRFPPQNVKYLIKKLNL